MINISPNLINEKTNKMNHKVNLCSNRFENSELVIKYLLNNIKKV